MGFSSRRSTRYNVLDCVLVHLIYENGTVSRKRRRSWARLTKEITQVPPGRYPRLGGLRKVGSGRDLYAAMHAARELRCT